MLNVVFPQTLISGAVLFRGLGLGPDHHQGQSQDPVGGSLVPACEGWAMPEPRLSAGEHLCQAWSWWASPLLPLVSSLQSHTQSRVTTEVEAEEDEDAEWLTDQAPRQEEERGSCWAAGPPGLSSPGWCCQCCSCGSSPRREPEGLEKQRKAEVTARAALS